MILQKKEQYLANIEGAAGFVDIFARDRAGRVVIIEVKKSDAAARQAIQELVKYAALLRAKSLVKATEYRLIVLSVEWHELLIPFSEFFHATRYNLSGGRIVLGSDGIPNGIEWVKPKEKQAERCFSRRHFIWEYSDLEKARAGAQAGAERMREIGLRNFIFAVISLADDSYGISHIVYFAQQEETEEFYWEIIRRRFSEEAIEEFEEWMEDLTEPSDILGELADKSWDATDVDNDGFYNVMDAQSAQISDPEKAQHWLTEDVAKEVEIIRNGLFEDTDLSDRDMLTELCGMQGGSTYFTDVIAEIASKPEIDSLLAASNEVFFYNPIWQNTVQSIVAYAEYKRAISIELKAFANDDILKTLVWLAIGDYSFSPTFTVRLRYPNREELFAGVIDWNGRCPDWDELVSIHLDGDAESLMFHRHFGTIRSLNNEIMDALGISYGVVYVADPQADDPTTIPVSFRGRSFDEKKSRLRSVTEILSCDEFVRTAISYNAQSDFNFAQALRAAMNNSPDDSQD